MTFQEISVVMKPFLIHLLLLFIIADGAAQALAPVGAKWKYLSCYGINPTAPCNCSVGAIEVTGYEVVQGKTASVFSRWDQEIYLLEENNMIYVFEKDTFQLLMDFNLTVGDTLYHRYTNNGFNINSIFNFQCQCISITDKEIVSVIKEDTIIEVDGLSLKQLKFTSYLWDDTILTKVMSQSFTERLGGAYWNDESNSGWDFVMGIMGGPPGVCLLGSCCNDVLLCYQDADITYDFSEDSMNCEYTSLPPAPDQNVHIYLHTSADGNILNIENNSVRHVIKQVNILDMNGREIYSFNNKTAAIDISALPQGIYLCQINLDNHEIVSRKFIRK